MSYIPDDGTWINLFEMGFDPTVGVGIFDPTNRLSGVPTLGSDGALTLPMAGGWVVANQTSGAIDPGTDGIFGAIPLSARGRPCEGDVEVGFAVRVRPSSTAPVAADDIGFFAGLINDNTLFGTSVRGVFTVGDFTTTVGPRTRGVSITAGVAASLNSGGTLSALGVGWEAQFAKAGKGGGSGASIAYGLRNTLINSSLELIAGTGANATIGVVSPGTGRMNLVFGGFRTRLANVTAKSIPMIIEVSQIRLTRY